LTLSEADHRFEDNRIHALFVATDLVGDPGVIDFDIVNPHHISGLAPYTSPSVPPRNVPRVEVAQTAHSRCHTKSKGILAGFHHVRMPVASNPI
jgi:hypothetical protein